MTELCLVRLGFQCRGLRAVLFGARLGRAIERSVREAITADAGLLHSDFFRLGPGHFGLFQYWRSYDALEAWSHRPPHSDWWREAAERMRTRGDFGIYHETYLVPRDRIESIYWGCSPAGLAAFGVTGEPTGPDTNSRGRLRRATTARPGVDLPNGQNLP